MHIRSQRSISDLCPEPKLFNPYGTHLYIFLNHNQSIFTSGASGVKLLCPLPSLRLCPLEMLGSYYVHCPAVQELRSQVSGITWEEDCILDVILVL